MQLGLFSQDLPLQLRDRFEVAVFLSQLALVGIDVDRVEDRLLEQIGELRWGQGIQFLDAVGAVLLDERSPHGVVRLHPSKTIPASRTSAPAQRDGNLPRRDLLLVDLASRTR